MRFTALTPCFRAEAGAAGRDTRGMIRQHQFQKSSSSRSRRRSLAGRARADARLRRGRAEGLDLPFRTMTLCTGDMGFASAEDLRHRGVAARAGGIPGDLVLLCLRDFQARRMNARYRPERRQGHRFVHTLNGSGVAVGRALIAVLENYQNEDGSVTIPAALQPYMGGLTRIERQA